MAEMQKITHEPGSEEAWVCICGNRPDSEGFYPCDRHGKEVDPMPEDWTTDLYVCDRCGRMIDQKTLAVVGQRANDPAKIHRS
jgi:hypothetical protein